MTSVASSDDIAFIDRVLESWAAWARDAGIPRCAQASLRYRARGVMGMHVLPMSDDSLEIVDGAVAKLDTERRTVVRVNYLRPDCESRFQKAQLCGLSVGAYTRTLRHAQLDVYERIAERLR